MFLIVSYLVGALIGLQQGKNINIHDDNGSIDIVDRFSQMNQFARFAYIAKNNLTVSIKNLIFGIFSLGFFSVIYTFYNGLFSGIVIGKCSKFLSLEEILNATLPHSIEIIGFILFGYLGFLLSTKFLFAKSNCTYLTMLIIFIIATIIIILSAFIESRISIS